MHKRRFIHLFNYCLFIVFFSVVFTSCITPYKVDAIDPGNGIVVEGWISNQNEPYKVRLSKIAKYEKGFDWINFGVSGATVTIIDENNAEFQLHELFTNTISLGYYSTHLGQLTGEVGKSYRLRIETGGKIIESTPVKIEKPVAPDSLYYEFEEKTAFEDAGFNIYVDVTDAEAERNYYKWNWRKYEKLYICAFDQLPCCESECYKVTSCMSCDENSIISDTYVNGNQIKRKLVIRAAYNGRCPLVYKISQQTISKETYDFLDAVNKQNNNSGNIFDTPPFPIKGNLVNVSNPDEIVFGYFAAAGEFADHIRIDRSSVGVPPVSEACEVSSRISPTPPCTSCMESATRTRIAPPKWE